MEIDTLHIGIAAAIFTAVDMLPQLTKIIRQKKVEQISLKMVLIMLTGLSFWICMVGCIEKPSPFYWRRVLQLAR